MTISRYDDLKINTNEIQITAVYFRGTSENHGFESFPKRMVYDGREYNFIESGMRFLVRKGQQLIKLFDVSDGQNLFRLRYENDHWTLVNIQATGQAA